MQKQFWLAELDVHGNPTLKDGPHRNKRGVEHAARLLDLLGLKGERHLVLAEVTLTEIAGPNVDTEVTEESPPQD